MSVHLERINLLNVLLWICPFNPCDERRVWLLWLSSRPAPTCLRVTIRTFGRINYTETDQERGDRATTSSTEVVSAFRAKASLPVSRARRLQVIPSQQRYWLKQWQRLIWNILATMSGCVILLSQHPVWFMGLILLLFTMSLLGLKGLVGSDVSWRFSASLSTLIHFRRARVRALTRTRCTNNSIYFPHSCFAIELSSGPLSLCCCVEQVIVH